MFIYKGVLFVATNSYSNYSKNLVQPIKFRNARISSN